MARRSILLEIYNVEVYSPSIIVLKTIPYGFELLPLTTWKNVKFCDAMTSQTGTLARWSILLKIDNGKVYLSAFRTNKEYENQGYFSKLYKFMENDLKSKGFKSLTLGVEPKEIRNIQIYFNWGFTKYIKTGFCKYANGEVAIVNYYEKELN